MNAAFDCIQDTLRLLLQEAIDANKAAKANQGSAEQPFEIGRSEALTESLHTWANQLETFGVARQLNGTWDQVKAFLVEQGY